MAFSAAVNAGLWFFCIRRMASLTTYMSLRTLVCWLCGNGFEFLVESDFVAEVLDQFAEREHGIRLQLLGADVVGDSGAGVGAEHAF